MNVKDDKFSNNHIKPANSADIRYLEVDISKKDTVPISSLRATMFVFKPPFLL